MSEYETEEERIERLVALNPEQRKAFNRLIRAAKDCNKLNVYFYQNLETLSALNGDNVRTVVGAEETQFEDYGPRNPHHYTLPSVNTVCSFADDQHHIILHDD